MALAVSWLLSVGWLPVQPDCIILPATEHHRSLASTNYTAW